MEELNAQKEVLVSLADCCTVLQGKNVDKKKTNEEAQGLPVIVGASDLVCGALSPKRWCSQPLSNPVYSEKGDILVSVSCRICRPQSVDGSVCIHYRCLLSGTQRQTERRTLGLDRLVSYRHRRQYFRALLADSMNPVKQEVWKN